MINTSNLKVRLIVMNFLEFAVWGAYLTSMGNYLGKAGMGEYISWFYAIQGIVSIFMPTLMGIVADRYVPSAFAWHLSPCGRFVYDSSVGYGRTKCNA